MTAEIKLNKDDSLTIKYLTSEELQIFANFFGNPIDNTGNLINPQTKQYKSDLILNGKKYAYSVYDKTNNGKDLYTIDIQKMK